MVSEWPDRNPETIQLSGRKIAKQIGAVMIPVALAAGVIVGSCNYLQSKREGEYASNINSDMKSLPDDLSKVAERLNYQIQSNIFLDYGPDLQAKVDFYSEQEAVGNYDYGIRRTLPVDEKEAPERRQYFDVIPYNLNKAMISNNVIMVAERTLIISTRNCALKIDFDEDFKIVAISPVQWERTDDKKTKKIKSFDVRELQLDEPLNYDEVKLGDSIAKLYESFEAYKLFRKQAHKVEKKERREVESDHSKDVAFDKKITRGAVLFNTQVSGWNGGASYCSGWVAGRDVIGTAAHCILNDLGRGKRSEVMLTRVNKLVIHRRKPIPVPVYRIVSDRSYAFAHYANEDLAVIVLDRKVFRDKDVLPVRSDPIVNGNYYAAHFAGYGSGQFWKYDEGAVEYRPQSGDFGETTYDFHFPAQGGNSGGPIVDYQGNVVSLFALGGYRGSAGPVITQEKVDRLIDAARERLAKLKKRKKK